jgi:hypothetical protein
VGALLDRIADPERSPLDRLWDVLSDWPRTEDHSGFWTGISARPSTAGGRPPNAAALLEEIDAYWLANAARPARARLQVEQLVRSLEPLTRVTRPKALCLVDALQEFWTELLESATNASATAQMRAELASLPPRVLRDRSRMRNQQGRNVADAHAARLLRLLRDVRHTQRGPMEDAHASQRRL